VPSALLTKSQGGPVTVDAAVILPKEYNSEPNRKFPVLFKVSGYGGNYHRYSGSAAPGAPLDTIPVITVYLDGNCSGGHSVYANSDKQWPWGDALTTEFIPALEKTIPLQWRQIADRPQQRRLDGRLAANTLPKGFRRHLVKFGPTRLISGAFKRLTCYNDKNMFYGKDSTLNSVATVAGFFPWVTMKDIYMAEKRGIPR